MPVLDLDFWSNKSVFLTGHSGFKGTWMTVLLSQLGANVHGYSLAPVTNPNIFDVTGAKLLCSSHQIEDLANVAALNAAFEHANPDIMIHMAAQPIVSTSYNKPAETFATNVMGAVNFLECVRTTGEGAALVVSSDKCYLNNNVDASFVESDPLGGFDPYSASKAGTEIAVTSWRASFFGENKLPVKLASARAGNVIGGGDWSENRLLPDAARSFAQGDPLIVRNPVATRPWQHVLEPVVAYLYLVQCMVRDDREDLSESWNIGPIPPKVYTVKQVVDRFIECWPGDKASWMLPKKAQSFSEAKTLSLNSSKIMEKTGWRPVLDMPEAVAWTAEWYATYYNEGVSAAKALTIDQINRYLTRFASIGES